MKAIRWTRRTIIIAVLLGLCACGGILSALAPRAPSQGTTSESSLPAVAASVTPAETPTSRAVEPAATEEPVAPTDTPAVADVVPTEAVKSVNKFDRAQTAVARPQATNTAASAAAPTSAPTKPAAAPAVRPAATSPPSTGGGRCGATCNDGTSSNATGQGACSRHKGVKAWVYCP